MDRASARRLLVVMIAVMTALVVFSGDALSSQRRTAEDESRVVEKQFEQLQEDLERQYQTYKTDIENTYRAYQRIIEEEFRRYEQQILAHWPEAETGTRKKWVEYSPDYKTRQVVDFGEGAIRIDMIIPPDKMADMDAALLQRLTELIEENQKTAFEHDQLSRSIEDRMKDAALPVRTGTVDDAPILAMLLTGKTDPSKDDLRKAAALLKQQSTVDTRPSKNGEDREVSLRVSLPPDSIQKRALAYQAEVERYAGQRGLSEPLVYAVIHTESAFNPMARSHIPAYGLMQIVPNAAGRDASKILFGQEALLSPSFLYNGDNNINTGTAYLYILYNRYLKEINHPASRLYCAIAAYNTGAGNVARAFTGSTSLSRAAAAINRLSPQQVYSHLLKNLPFQETRDYLERVTTRMRMYGGM